LLVIWPLLLKVWLVQTLESISAEVFGCVGRIPCFLRFLVVMLSIKVSNFLLICEVGWMLVFNPWHLKFVFIEEVEYVLLRKLWHRLHLVDLGVEVVSGCRFCVGFKLIKSVIW
jgi:hypothetical protein